MDIRAELRELMDSHNYSTAFVANATGLAKSTISMWLNGNYNGKLPRFQVKSEKLLKVPQILTMKP